VTGTKSAGTESTGTESAGGGHGLAGMRERAASVDGSVEAGPGAGGGFLVAARLPLGRPPPADRTAIAPATGATSSGAEGNAPVTEGTRS
jgi:hypothetical protein